MTASHLSVRPLPFLCPFLLAPHACPLSSVTRAQITAKIHIIVHGLTRIVGHAATDDFDLHFSASLAPLSYATFTITPLDSTQHCGGGDMVQAGATASFSKHVPFWPPEAKEAPSALDGLIDSVVAEQRAMLLGTTTEALAGGEQQQKKPLVGPPKAEMVVMENSFLRVYVDMSIGIQAVYDKGTGKNHSFSHTLMIYKSNTNDAYDFKPAGPATPVGAPAAPDDTSSGQCLVNCAIATPSGAPFTCHEDCAGKSIGDRTLDQQPKLLASSASLGPVMQEVRFQISSEHKTRVRLWVSDDPAVGGRIELAHRVGVLEQMTEITSRFTLGTLQNKPHSFFSEDNGYEIIEHSSGSGAQDINLNHYPSQMSTFITDGETQLSVALEHGHGVASLYNGSLDVMQHRRGGPFAPGHGTVVLDDTDRILTDTWISLGNASHSNMLRHSNKLRLNHPLLVMFGDPLATNGRKRELNDPLARHASGLDASLHLQTARATSADATEVLVNLLHVYSSHETPSTRAQPKRADLSALLWPFRPDLAGHFNETTLNGMLPKDIAESEKLSWQTTAPPSPPAPPAPPSGGGSGAVIVQPFEFRTFLAKEF